MQWRVEVFVERRWCVWPMPPAGSRQEAIDQGIEAIRMDGYQRAQVLEKPLGSRIPWDVVWEGAR